MSDHKTKFRGKQRRTKKTRNKWRRTKIIKMMDKPTTRQQVFVSGWKDCVGCALCSLVCPVEGCITMIKLPQHDSKTWNQLVKELPQPMTWESLREFQKKYGIEIH